MRSSPNGIVPITTLSHAVASSVGTVESMGFNIIIHEKVRLVKYLKKKEAFCAFCPKIKNPRQIYKMLFTKLRFCSKIE